MKKRRIFLPFLAILLVIGIFAFTDKTAFLQAKEDEKSPFSTPLPPQ